MWGFSHLKGYLELELIVYCPRRGETELPNLKGFKDLCLRAKARILPQLDCLSRIRSPESVVLTAPGAGPGASQITSFGSAGKLLTLFKSIQ